MPFYWETPSIMQGQRLNSHPQKKGWHDKIFGIMTVLDGLELNFEHGAYYLVLIEYAVYETWR